MNVLSLDTTADICSIAVEVDGTLVSFHERRPREHAKIVLPEIQKLCESQGILPGELDRVVFGRGPGSFTGVRIAAGVSQGLAFAAECSIVPVSTLQSLAFAVREQARTEIWAALDARMHEIYFARFQMGESGLPELIDEEVVTPPSAISVRVPEDVVLVGNGWQTDYDYSPDVASVIDNRWLEPSLPDAKDHLALAEILISKQMAKEIAPEDAIPTYLRDKVTWDNKPKVGS